MNKHISPIRSDGLRIVQGGRHFALADKDDHLVTGLVYRWIEELPGEDGLRVVQDDDELYGLVGNRQPLFLLDCLCASVGPVEADGLRIVKSAFGPGYLSLFGKDRTLVGFIYERISPPRKDGTRVLWSDGSFAIYGQGQFLTDFVRDEAGPPDA
jgi:hypothetical protein